MKNLICLFFIACAFCFQFRTTAQTDRYTFRHLTNEDGLSDATVTGILQDHKGFMWFATINGLNCYNGYEFTVYRNITNDSLSLSNNRVESIYEDSDNILWISTSNGLNRFNREQDNFKCFYYDKDDPNSLSNNYIREVIEEDNGLWIATLGGGLNYYNKKNNVFTRYRFSNDKNSINSDYVVTVFVDSKNRLWCGTMGEGLNLLNRETNDFLHVKFDNSNPAINVIRCIYQVSENEFLIGTDAGLVRFYPEKVENNYYLYKHSAEDKTSISKGHVRKIFRDNKGNLWVATQQGLNVFDEKEDKFIHVIKNENKSYSITSNEIWDITQDNQGTVWFGTFKGGVNILNLDHIHFHNWRHDPINPYSLINSSVLSFEENPDTTLWLGIDHGGLSLFDRHKGTIKTYSSNPNDEHALSSDAVVSLMIDSKEQLWIGTWGGGLNRFLPATEKFVRLSPNEVYYTNWHVWDLVEDKYGQLWTASSSGISKYSANTSEYEHYTHSDTDKTTISHDYNWAVFEDHIGNLWVGNTTGLNKYNRESNNFTYYPYITFNGKEAHSYTVLTIAEDEQKRLWIGTNGKGLNLFFPDTGLFKAYTKKNGLASNEICGILTDDENNLWISNNMGISRIAFNDKDSITEIYNFDNGSGLQVGQFNPRAAFRSLTGELFFGGNKGFVYFKPDSIKPNRYKPEVFITELLIYNKPAKIDPNGKTGSPLRKHISVTNEITLTHKQSIFSLKFAALSYISPEKNQYAYMLEGLEENWNHVRNKRDATYTNLNPGQYVFKVKASNNDGIWGDKITTLTINILPPWWKTLWFQAIIVLFVASLIFALYLYRVKSFKMQNQLLEKKVEERTNELKATNCHLEEKQEEILLQNSEIQSQNTEINKKNMQLESQKAKIEKMNEQLRDNIQKLKEAFAAQKKMEQELIQANKMASLGVLSAGIAHEINNPINFVYAGINSLRRDFEDLEVVIEEINKLNPETENIKEKLENIQKLKEENYFDEAFEAIPQIIKDIKLGADRTAEIVKGLRSFSRTDTGSKQNLNVNEGIETALLLLKNKYKNHVEIVRNFNDNIPELRCYPSKINQVFLNIISNAIDAIEEKGKIWITTKKENDNIVVSIKDSGIGIPEDVKSKLFDPFFTTKDVGKGTGLGLSITYGTIAEHNGSIEVNSEPGEGAEFIISLPIRN